MAQENVQFVRGLYEAFGKGDIGTVLGSMDSGIEWREAESFIYAGGSPYVGPEAVRDGVFARLASEWDHYTVTPEEWLDAGNHVIVLGTYTGTHKRTGRAIRAQFAHVWAVKRSRILRFQQYTDTKQFADAVA